jgi:hypothetical protein
MMDRPPTGRGAAPAKILAFSIAASGIAFAACGEAIKPGVNGTIVLQCTGEAIMVGPGNKGAGQRQSFYKIDLVARTVSLWSAEKSAFDAPKGKTETDGVRYYYTDRSAEVLRVITIDTSLGTVSDKAITARSNETFQGRCARVDNSAP